MIKLLPILFVLSLLSSASGRKIKFTDCNHGEVKEIDVDPCNKEPCMFKKGQTATLTVKGIPSNSTDKGQLKLYVLVSDIPVEFPGIEPDICRHVKCPIIAGNEYTVVLKIKIEDYFPPMTSVITAKATGPTDQDLILCASAPAGIED